MSGETSDNSQFCKLELFEGVMFVDETAPFPAVLLKLGHYLGPSRNVGIAVTTNIFTQNEQVLHRSMFRLLTPDKIADKDEIDASEQFMARVYERLGSWVLPRDLEDIGQENTLEYDLYEEKIQNRKIFPQLAEELESISEVGDHYIGATMLLPRGD